MDRITQNFALGYDNGVIDDAIKIDDQMAVDVAHWLLKEEGLFVGSSSAMNIAGAILLCVNNSNDDNDSSNDDDDDGYGLKSGSSVVTVICDGGQRHLTRFWNREFILKWNLLWPKDDEVAWKCRLDTIFSKRKQ